MVDHTFTAKERTGNERQEVDEEDILLPEKHGSFRFY
jgi:hypothetical protein